MIKRPREFKNMINGYDRYAVDNAIASYDNEIMRLNHEIRMYHNEIARINQICNNIKKDYEILKKDAVVRDTAAKEMSKIALKEANSLIKGASTNADLIIKEALSSARMILLELAYTAKMNENAKGQVKHQLDDILKKIDEFESIELPDLRWLENYDQGRRSR